MNNSFDLMQPFGLALQGLFFKVEKLKEPKGLLKLKLEEYFNINTSLMS